MLARGDQLRTSTLTLGEILVKPLERGDDAVYRRYEEASLACAAQVRADLFLTNDERVSQSPCRAFLLPRCYNSIPIQGDPRTPSAAANTFISGSRN